MRETFVAPVHRERERITKKFLHVLSSAKNEINRRWTFDESFRAQQGGQRSEIAREKNITIINIVFR